MPQEDGDTLILIAYDGSDHAKEAIRAAGRRMAPGGRAIVATIYEPLDKLPFVGAMGGPGVGEIFSAAREAAQETAEQGAEMAREAGFEAEAVARDDAPVWNSIVELAEERDVDLIVIGSRGLSGLKHVALGSVAAAVAQHSRRSVLIVHDR